MSYPEIKLNDDPKTALREVAAYLRTVRAGPDRRVVMDEINDGFWQTRDWIEGLTSIAAECDRIASKKVPLFPQV